jgi:pimeloyl-ACP methyl ester carboxylesterase
VLASGAAAFHTWVNLTGVHLTLTDRLKELALPVLLMWGDRDTVCKYEDGLVAARYPRDGQLVAFTGCGHAPFWERPDEFARVLLTWLDNIHIPSRV